MVTYEIINSDVIAGLQTLNAGQFDTCITSPPYFGLRDYGVSGQIGIEETPEQYVQKLVEVFREVRRVLRDDGTLWVNIGDTYATGTKARRKQSRNPGVGANTPEAQNSVPRIGTPKGCKTKDLIGIPWLLAFSLRADGWYLRQDIIWNKTNAMPESVKDRCVKSHEYIFLFSKSPKYYFDNDSIKEPAKHQYKQDVKKNPKYSKSGTGQRPQQGLTSYNYNTAGKRSVWNVAVGHFAGEHYAAFPPDLIRPCILAGSRKGGHVLDPFAGSGTTVYVSLEEGRNAVGIELKREYAILARQTVESCTQQVNFNQLL